MQDESGASFDVYLVEDVILTLCNLRGLLGWLADADSPRSHSQRQAGLARIERQIDLLEDRARRVRDSLHAASAAYPMVAATAEGSAGVIARPLPDPVQPRPAPFDPSAAADPTAPDPDDWNIFVDTATGGEPTFRQEARQLVFRSRRAAAE